MLQRLACATKGQAAAIEIYKATSKNGATSATLSSCVPGVCAVCRRVGRTRIRLPGSSRYSIVERLRPGPRRRSFSAAGGGCAPRSKFPQSKSPKPESPKPESPEPESSEPESPNPKLSDSRPPRRRFPGAWFPECRCSGSGLGAATSSRFRSAQPLQWDQ
jgi:hypothetical protein